MKPTIKYCLILGAGIVIGAIVTMVPVARGAGKQTSRLCFASIFDNARIAIELQAGKQTDVLARLAEQLPAQTMLAEKLDRSSPWCTNALWMIKAYYQIGDTPPPANIASALERLPAEPPAMCRATLQKLFGGQIPNIN